VKVTIGTKKNGGATHGKEEPLQQQASKNVEKKEVGRGEELLLLGKLALHTAAGKMEIKTNFTW